MPDVPFVPMLWRFPAHPSAVRRARHAVAEALPRGLPSGLTGDLGLLASELVTNAIRHGANRAHGEHDDLVELVLWPADGHYWLAVSDTGAGMPELARPGPRSEGGRGLVLVDSLAAVWAVVPRQVRGKSVVAGLAFGHGG
jgi:anti-sigma regulatory factor (Ser/Thr protein kinase)